MAGPFQLTGLVGRQTAGTGMTAKGAPLSFAEEDNNFLLLLNAINLLGGAFNNDGTINIPAPASSQIVTALLAFMNPVGHTVWMPCEMANANLNPANGSVWVEAAGQSLPQTDYPKLFTLYGTKYNAAGDDPTTVFRVPDLKRRFLYGRGAAGQEITGPPATGTGFGGEETHKLLAAESGLPSHHHLLPGGSFIQAGGGADAGGGAVNNWKFVTQTTDIDPADAANHHNNLPPYALGVFYILAGYKIGGVMVA